MLAVATGLFVLFVVLTPILLSSGKARDLAVRMLQSRLNARVDLDALEFSWGRGLTLHGLTIHNPEGFAPRPALRIERFQAGVSFSALLRGGGIKAQMLVDAPELRVQRLADGRVNLTELVELSVSWESKPSRRTSGGGQRQIEAGGRFEAQVRFVLSGGRIEIADAQAGIEQTIEDLEVQIANQAMGGPLTLSLDGHLVPGGTISATAVLDPSQEVPIGACKLETTGLDLGAAAPILAALMPETRFEVLRGRVAGEVTVRPAAMGSAIDVGGELAIDDLDVRGGPLGAGRGLVVPKGSLRPGLRYDREQGIAVLGDTNLDFGFLRLQALDPAAGRALLEAASETPILACTVQADLAALAAQPGLLPGGAWIGRMDLDLAARPATDGSGEMSFAAVVRGSELLVPAELLPKGLRLAGPAALVARSAGRAAGDMQATLQSLSGSGRLTAPRVSWLGNDLDQGALDLTLREGKLALQAPAGMTLNGGALAARIDVEDLASAAPRIAFDLTWQGGKAEYGLTPVLRYAVPILAGLPTADIDRLSSIDFRTTAALRLRGGGSLPRVGSLLEALESWSADGELQLANGSFTPGAAMNALFQLLGQTGQVTFDDIVTKVKVEKGRVRIDGFRMGGKSGSVVIDGSTSLRGDLDLRVDLTDALSQHRDGQRLLAALGGGRAVIPLDGTLGKPRLDVAALLSKGAQGALRGFLEEMQKGKDPGKALRDILKGR
jgi:hypothetical protein